MKIKFLVGLVVIIILSFFRYILCKFEYEMHVVHYYESIVDTRYEGEIIKLSKGKHCDTLFVKQRYTTSKIYFNNSDWLQNNISKGDQINKLSMDSVFVFNKKLSGKELKFTYKFKEQELSTFWEIFFLIE